MNDTPPPHSNRASIHPYAERRAPSLRHLTALGALALAVAAGLTGCGGGDTSTPDATQAIDGRELGKASQLTGTWMRVSRGEFIGFEFLKEGKVLATTGSIGRTVTLDFSVLDGGRLSLVAPGGRTTVYGATLDGDLLQLAREDSGSTSQRFRRLPSGKTLAVAIQEHAAELEAGRQKRNATLEKLFAAGDLVLVKADTQGTNAVLALKVDHWRPDINGTVVMDDEPARNDALRPVRLHPVSGSTTPVDDVTDRIQIQLDVGPAIAPTGQQDIQGRIVLIAEGPTDNSTLTGTAEFPRIWTGQAGVVLQRDGGLHGKPAEKMKEQLAALRHAMDQVAAPLGGRAVLTGQKTGLGGSAPETISMTIERVGESDQYKASVTVGTRNDAAAVGGLDTVIGRGALYVNLSTGEQWRLHVDDAGRVFSGPWRPNTRADFISSGNVELTLGRVWTVEEVAAERATLDRFLNADLRTPKAFTGFLQSGRGGEIEYWPVWMELQTAADGTATGKAWLLGQGVGVELNGRLSGTTFQFNTTRAMPGSATSRNLAQQRWQLNVTAVDSQPRLGGTMSATMGGTSTVELQPVDPSSAEASRRAMLDLLRDGVFTVVNTTISRRPDPTWFRFQVDDTTGAITGEAIGYDLTGSNPSALPPGLIQGTLAEEHGHVVVKLTIDGSPEPVREREGRRFEFTLAANSQGDDLILTAWNPPGPGNQAWLRLTKSEPGKPVVVSEEQRLRLAAQKLGARVKAPDQPTRGSQAVLLVHATERDARVGQIFTANGRYCHGNSIATAALHAGVMAVGETAVVRLTYGAPFTANTPPVAKNGVTSGQANFAATNTVPTFTLERIAIE